MIVIWIDLRTVSENEAELQLRCNCGRESLFLDFGVWRWWCGWDQACAVQICGSCVSTHRAGLCLWGRTRQCALGIAVPGQKHGNTLEKHSSTIEICELERTAKMTTVLEKISIIYFQQKVQCSLLNKCMSMTMQKIFYCSKICMACFRLCCMLFRQELHGFVLGHAE